MKDKQKQHKKAQNWLKSAGAELKSAVAVVGALFSSISEACDESDYTPLPGVTDLRVKYTSEWLKTAPLEELETERSKVQVIFLNTDSNVPSYLDLYTLLNEFDDAIDNKKSNFI